MSSIDEEKRSAFSLTYHFSNRAAVEGLRESRQISYLLFRFFINIE